MLIAFAIAGIIVGSLISIPIWTSMTGKSIMAMKDEMGNPAFSNAFKVIQVVSTFIGFFIPALLTAAMLNRRPSALLGFARKITAKQIFLVLSIMFLALFISFTLGYLNQQIPISASWQSFFQKLENEYQAQVEAIMQLKSPVDFFIGLFVMAFLPALCEETLFRGGMQNFLSRATRSPWLSIIIISIIFSIFHLSYYGFLSRMFLGIILGLIFQYTGSLWLCIIAHFFNNALAVTQLYYYTSHGKSVREVSDQSPAVFIGLIAIPIVVFLFLLLKKISPKKQQSGIELNEIRNNPPWQINN
jgi:membrane protease YdiL (CAAX protease family)